jgi:hypothetical protein
VSGGLSDATTRDIYFLNPYFLHSIKITPTVGT